MKGWNKRLHHNQLSILLSIAVIIFFIMSVAMGIGEHLVVRSRGIGLFIGMITGTYLHDVRLHGRENNHHQTTSEQQLATHQKSNPG